MLFKKSVGCTLRSFAVAVLLLGYTFASGAPATLRVRADSWMPFNGEPSEEKPGYVVEFLREIFEPQGIKVDYQVMPWAAALTAAESGEVDGVICANEIEAAKLQIGREAIAEPQFSLFVRKENPWKYQNLRSLQEVRLGAAEGYSYWASIDGYIKKATTPAITIYSGNTPSASAVQDLVDGKIDVLVESVLVFYWALKNTGHKYSEFRSAYTEPTEPLYVAFTKNKPGA